MVLEANFTEKILLKDLKKQNKYSQFFQEWKEQEFNVLAADSKKIIKELPALSQSIDKGEELIIT